MSRTNTAIRRLAGVVLFLVVVTAASFSQNNSYQLSLETVDGKTVLDIRTVNALPCLGYAIRNTVRWPGDTVQVLLSGFIRATPCIQGLDQATAHIYILRKPVETIYLDIREGEYSDLWKISFDADGFHALPIHNSFTSFNH